MPFKKGHKSGMNGKKHSAEARNKMRIAKLGKMPSNLEQLKAMPRWNKGKKTGIVPSSAFKEGHKSWNNGIKIDKEKYPNMGHNVQHSESSKIKMSEARKGKSAHWNKGEKSPMWKGGVTPINKLIRSSMEYRLWREAVFKRDNWTCVWCGQRGGVIHPDHIKPFALYPELRFAIDNGRTLCVPCHKKTDTYGHKTR